MIQPAPGMVFIVEDKRDDLQGTTLEKVGFIQSEAHQRNVGVTGIVMAVNEKPCECVKCGHENAPRIGVRIGDHVIYSKFVAEQLEVKGDDGKWIENLRSLPVDMILGFIQ